MGRRLRRRSLGRLSSFSGRRALFSKVRRMGKHRGGPGFAHRYLGPEVLEQLLAEAGSPCSAEEAIELLREGLSQGRSPSDLIPDLFEAEPHFAGPDAAQLTFENLLGLCDLLRRGEPLPQRRAERPQRPRPEKAPPPGPFPEEGPDEEWVERAWRYLDELPDRELHGRAGQRARGALDHHARGGRFGAGPRGRRCRG